MVINIEVKNKKAIPDGSVLVCGNSDYQIKFTFDSEWEVLTYKTARFVFKKDGSMRFIDVSFAGDVVDVPVLSEIRYVYVGVYADALQTTTPAEIACEYSIRCNSGESDDGYILEDRDQLMALFNAVAQEKEIAVEAAETAKTAAEEAKAANNEAQEAAAKLNDATVVQAGEGLDSVVMADGQATGDYSVAGGTNDSTILEEITGYDIANLPDSLIEENLGEKYVPLKTESQKETTAAGDISYAFGAGAQALTAGALAFGVAANAGCKGFYWFNIDFSNRTITLTETQARYVPVLNKNPVWSGNAVSQLGQLSAGDMLSVHDGKEWYHQIEITAVNTENGIVTVKSFPFGETNTVLLATPTHYGVYCTNKPYVGVADLGFASLATGMGTKATGTLAQAHGSLSMAVGFASCAEGRETEAYGHAAHSEGMKTCAVGTGSHAEGCSTVASGEQSHAEGYNTYASNEQSHAEGNLTSATGKHSHAEGWQSEAEGNFAHAEGGAVLIETMANSMYEGTKASGDYSHAEGGGSRATGLASHAEGYAVFCDPTSGVEQVVEASGAASHAEGGSTTASGICSHAEGGQTKATGECAHAEGGRAVSTGLKIQNTYGEKEVGEISPTSNTAEGARSHAEGEGTHAKGRGSHAEGLYTYAGGYNSHAEGQLTQALASGCHAEGWDTVAKGNNSHSEGNGTAAIGAFSHAEGQGTVATADASHVQGRFNVEDTDKKYAHIVGNGSSKDRRSNAHTVDWSGNAWFAGDVKSGTGKLATEAQVEESYQNAKDYTDKKIAAASTGGASGMVREFESGELHATSFSYVGTESKIYVVTLWDELDSDGDIITGLASIVIDYRTNGYGCPYGVYLPLNGKVVKVMLSVANGTVSFSIMGSYGQFARITGYC